METSFSQYRRHLPHWRQTGAAYFVTWRLKAGQQPLAPAERTIVADAIRHFRGTRYDLIAFVVMDDHCHVLVQPLEPFKLDAIVHSWKSFTAHELQRAAQRHGSVWLDETYDRIIRNQDEVTETAVYIVRNPKKRWPECEHYEWVEPLEL
jgi:REP element-mobilizing transposase RayT